MGRYPLAALAMIGMVAAGCATQSQIAAESPTAADQTVRTGPISADTHFAAGQLAEAQNKLPAAIDQYQQAIKLNPSHRGSLYRLAVVYAEMKEYPQSIDTWKQYIQATHQAATAYGDLGFCQELAGQSDAAAASYQAGIARDAKNVPCHVNYGLMLARAGNIPGAVQAWQPVLSPAEIHYNLGSIYADQGRKEEARYEYERALQLDPKLVEAKTRVAALDEN
jgi:tetratricopeptide (TPR) repeat protein